MIAGTFNLSLLGAVATRCLPGAVYSDGSEPDPVATTGRLAHVAGVSAGVDLRGCDNHWVEID